MLSETSISTSSDLTSTCKTDHFGTFEVFLFRRELSNEHAVGSVPQFGSFDHDDGGSGNFANFRVDADPLGDFKCT